ncbi:hypothetical protein [Nonomuraea sp. NPDC003214]
MVAQGNVVLLYDVAARRWRTVRLEDGAAGRCGDAAAGWTGTSLLLWGCEADHDMLSGGTLGRRITP